MVCFVNRSHTSPENKESIKSDIYKFLFIANNGSLLVSIIYLAEVYRASGFAPFTIGLLILIIGSLCYLKNLSDGCLAQFFHPDKIKYLCNIPCTIIKLVKVSYECCRCEYYDIVTITEYSDGTVVKETCCISIICLIWNIFCLMIKIVSTFFTVISYYIFLGFFWVFWKIFQFIYLKHLAEEKNEKNKVNGNVDNQPVDSHQINEEDKVINFAENKDNNQVNVFVNNNIEQSNINTNNQHTQNNQNNHTNNLPENPITDLNFNNDCQQDININFSNQQRNDHNYNNYYNFKRDDQEEKIDSERGEILDVNRKPKKPSNNINNYKEYKSENKNIYNINNDNKNIDYINDGSIMDNNNEGYNNNENNDNEKPAPNLGEIENHYKMGNEKEENKNQKRKEERPRELEFNNSSQNEDKLYDVII